MATKPITLTKRILPVIPADKSEAFLRKANSRVLSAETLKRCADSAKKFKVK